MKKRMPDLHYARWAAPDTSSRLEDQISASLELYAINPDAFGDPVGIIEALSDSLPPPLGGRSVGLIVVAARWKPPDDVLLDTIPGGTVLVCECDSPLDKLDSCWTFLTDYALTHKQEVIPPGIEIYNDFDADETNDTVSTELIIRVE